MYSIVEPVFGGLWARNVSIGRRAVVTRKGGHGSYNKYESVAPEQSTHARDTWQHAYRYRTVTVPYPPRHPKTQASDGSMRTRVAPAYACECANELPTFFARWGTLTLKGALSTLTRLRAFAEARGEYEAADSDTYPAQLSSAFLDSINPSAVKAAAERQAKAEAEGKTLTVQQQRRDGRSAAKTAFRSLRFLLDNAIRW